MKILTLAAAATILLSCNNASTTATDNKTDSPVTNPSTPQASMFNTLTDAEKADGWELLFDGTSTKGWHVFNKNTDGSAWKAEDGTLTLNPAEIKDGKTTGGGDLLNEEIYENFHLKLEWKVDTAGNSGIIIYSEEDPKYEYSWHTGLEIQVLDNERHPDRKFQKHRAGDLYDLVSSSPETVKPALEWNTVEIKSNKGKLEEWLNGTKVLDVTLWDDNWKTMVAGSKFKIRPDFGKYTKGHIGVQDHGNKVWYRNIRIKKL
ncbi:MAG: DUF1080 domain-containing protein [Chitinophagaceae bacterium]|nr:DUF1080 domain-containing protein [Chitinophagaceae bacterium]